MRTDQSISIPQGGQTVKAPKKAAPVPMHAAMQSQPAHEGGAIRTLREHQAHLDQTIHSGGAQQAQAKRNGG